MVQLNYSNFKTDTKYYIRYFLKKNFCWQNSDKLLTGLLLVVNRPGLRYNSGMSWQIYGHNQAVGMLQEYTKPEKLRHAYLLTGPKGVGKRTLALTFIKALNCKQPPAPGVPCGVCTTCQQIDRMAYSDLSILEPIEGHKDIRIEQVRELLRTINLAPFQSPYRVALFLGFQQITLSAANALLKTLEEPPPKALIILTADAQENLLPTIVSRCEVIRLRPLPVAQVEAILINDKKLPPADARLLAHITSGRIGAALRLYEDDQALKARAQLLDEVGELLHASRRARFAYVEQKMKRSGGLRDSVADIISLWLTFWRDVGILATGAEVPLVNIDREALIRKTADKVDMVSVQKIMTSLETGLKKLDVYVNSRLLAENLLLLWPRI